MNMDRNEYIRQIADDVKYLFEERLAEGLDLEDFIDEDYNVDTDEIFEYLDEACFCNDSVTGNASGSYTFNSCVAEKNIADAWDVMAEIYRHWGIEDNPFDKGAEYWDVTIRCYLLGDAIVYCMDKLKTMVVDEWENRNGKA